MSRPVAVVLFASMIVGAAACGGTDSDVGVSGQSTSIISTSSPSATSATTFPSECASRLWSFKIPDGWMANVVDPDRTDQSCVVVEPATSPIGKSKRATGGLFEESISEASGFAVHLSYSPRGGVAAELSSLARLVSLTATVTLDGAGVRVENVPANSFEARRLSAAENPRGLDVVRVTLVVRTEGPTRPGKTIHAAVVAHPRGGDLLISSGGDSDVPAADAAKAIDAIVASVVLK